MSNNLKTFFITCAGICFSLLYLAPQIDNFLLALFCVLLVPGLIVRHFFIDALYKGSVKYVPKRFVFNQYTITNEHCTVKYTPDEKIIVTDNIATNKRKDLRTFTLTKSDKVNINKCWNQVCKIFDSFVSLDSLVSFFSYDTTVDVKIIKLKEEPKVQEEIKIDTTNSGPKFVEMGNIRPDIYAAGTNIANKDTGNFVDINNIQEAKKVVERDMEAPEFVEMGQILTSGSKKIDVNNSSASEISILPGINIVSAKKIVEYRDTNGLFKSEEDFIKVANVKEHFVQKIKSMIIIGAAPQPKKEEEIDQGRIIDF